MGMQGYGIRTVGHVDTTTHRTFLENEHGEPVSFFHDVPLWADRTKGHVNMVCEIPRWTNAKLEIATGEALNPIKQDVKKGNLRFVANLFPFHGYPWNYGALPQTWENPTECCPHTGLFGDRDPVDVLDIGETIAFSGQIKQVKILGILALLDEGETDWKIIAIDVNDPMCDRLNDIDDVEKHCPGLLDCTRHWFRSYKIPDGKPANEFAFDGRFRNKEFALKVVDETNRSWTRLVSGSIPSTGPKYHISCIGRSVGQGSCEASISDVNIERGETRSTLELQAGIPSGSVSRSHYGIFPNAAPLV